MEQQTWTVVDEYLNGILIDSDPILEDALAANAQAKLPAFDVAPNHRNVCDRLAHATFELHGQCCCGLRGAIYLDRVVMNDGRAN